MSVDWFGRWTEDPSQPVEKWCDYDYLAAAIRRSGYEPKTSMEHLIDMILMYYEEQAPEGSVMDRIADIFVYVQDSGGWSEFDYEV